MWRQQFSMARALVHEDIIVELVTKKGMKICIHGSGLRKCMESSSRKFKQRLSGSCGDGTRTWRM